MAEKAEATLLEGGTCVWTYRQGMWSAECFCDDGYRCGPHPLTKDQLIEDLTIRLRQAQEQIRAGASTACQGGPSLSDEAFRAWVDQINHSTNSCIVVPAVPDDDQAQVLRTSVEVPCVLA